MKKRIVYIFAACLLLVSSLASAREAAETRLCISYPRIMQGQAVAVWSEGLEPCQALEVEFLKNRFAVLVSPEGQALALIGADLNAKTGTHTIRLLKDGQVIASTTIQVTKANYGTRSIQVNDHYAPPAANSQINRELAIARAIYSKATQAVLNKPFDEKMISSFLYWRMPLPGVTTSHFGACSIVNGQAGPPHAGMDIKGSEGAPVKAAAAGRVVMAQATHMGGNTVLIDHGTGMISGYRHLSEIKVEVEQNVEQGHVIGLVGSTGRSTAPHLHFDVRVSNVAVDPLSVLICTTFLRAKWEGR